MAMTPEELAKGTQAITGQMTRLIFDFTKEGYFEFDGARNKMVLTPKGSLFVQIALSNQPIMEIAATLMRAAKGLQGDPAGTDPGGTSDEAFNAMMSAVGGIMAGAGLKPGGGK